MEEDDILVQGRIVSTSQSRSHEDTNDLYYSEHHIFVVHDHHGNGGRTNLPQQSSSSRSQSRAKLSRWGPCPPRLRKFTSGIFGCSPVATSVGVSTPDKETPEHPNLPIEEAFPELQYLYDDSDIYEISRDTSTTLDQTVPQALKATSPTRAFSVISIEDTPASIMRDYSPINAFETDERPSSLSRQVSTRDCESPGVLLDEPTSVAIYGQLRQDVYDDEETSDMDGQPGSSMVHPAIIPTNQPPSIDQQPYNHHKRIRREICASDSDSDSDTDDLLCTRVLTASTSGSESESSLPSIIRVQPRKKRLHKTPSPSPPPREEQPTAAPRKRRRTVVPKPVVQDDGQSGRDEGSKNLPIAAHNRARRIVMPRNSDFPLATVSMRADIQFFHAVKRHRIASYSLPSQTSQRVADVCNVGNTIVIGYSRGPKQVSLVSLSNETKPRMTGLNHYPHSDKITCLASAGLGNDVIQFFTAGTDKKVCLWTHKNASARDRSSSETIFRSLTIPAALCKTDRTLLCGTGTKLLRVDIDHPVAKPSSAEFSNLVYQVHVHPSNPSVSILEVKHHEEQILVFDARNYNRPAASKFGYHLNSGKTSSFYRGSTWGSYFARGYSDGSVCFWDYRNPKKPVMRSQFQRSSPVIHALVTDRWIACYSNVCLTFADFDGNNLDSTQLS